MSVFCTGKSHQVCSFDKVYILSESILESYSIEGIIFSLIVKEICPHKKNAYKYILRGKAKIFLYFIKYFIL